MSNDEFKITVLNPPTPEEIQFFWNNGGCKALAQLIANSIRHDLERGAWTVIDGKAVPVAVLPFYEKDDIMVEEETCERTVP